MKPQKRYNSSFDIESEILALKRKGADKLKKAEKLEAKAKEHVLEANQPLQPSHMRQHLIEKADELRLKASKLRRSHEIIYEVKVPRLSRTLAAFNTRTLGFDQDNSVVLSK